MHEMDNNYDDIEMLRLEMGKILNEGYSRGRMDLARDIVSMVSTLDISQGAKHKIREVCNGKRYN